ncbi:aldehyde dehydrogenase family protein [Novosphingobium bradum]|uniref:Aldehyde dehydrogenase family protein n=1 Tax=Novosphingobium bradum TaxID=1737444 RepID=A0ABV7IS69_9SPHN
MTVTFQTPNRDILPRHTTIINGQVGFGSGAELAHVYAGTGEVTTELRSGTAADVDAAVAAARKAFPAWRALPGDKRRNLMFKLAELFEKYAPLLAELTTIETGNPIGGTGSAPADGAQKFRYFGGWADKIQGRTISPFTGPAHDYVSYEPYGVIGAIIPWNGPLFATTMATAPALAAGNCVVVKSPDLAPFSVLKLGEMFIEAGFPEGVFNVVMGGGDVGEAMVAHPGIDKIQFVGSGPTAKKVLRTAAETLKPCGLELGGKSPVIVFADANMQIASQRGLMGAVLANGQGCSNGTRLLVERPIYDQYLETLKTMAGYFPVGDPLNPGTRLGPVISEQSLDRILGMVNKSVHEEGHRLLCGGERAGGDAANGFFLPVTVVADVAHDSSLAQHEAFGPVLTVTPFDGEDEAIALANDTEYGLGGYIFTENLRRAHFVASQVDSGMIHVNGSGEGMTPCCPFGGMKQSGFGRLGGEEGLHEFLRVKNVWINMNKPA